MSRRSGNRFVPSSIQKLKTLLLLLQKCCVASNVYDSMNNLFASLIIAKTNANSLIDSWFMKYCQTMTLCAISQYLHWLHEHELIYCGRKRNLYIYTKAMFKVIYCKN